MLDYIIKDLLNVLRFLPAGIIAGMFAFVALILINRYRKGRNLVPYSLVSGSLLFMYIVILLTITFMSRESGSVSGIDLKIGSTWGINDRNRAYVVENIILFLPYGFLATYTLSSARNFLPMLFLGAATSLEIEYMQLITGRGFFQVDDVITNTLGAMIGFLLVKILRLDKDRTGLDKYNIFQIPVVLMSIALVLVLCEIVY